jgi:hypothetical protein
MSGRIFPMELTYNLGLSKPRVRSVGSELIAMRYSSPHSFVLEFFQHKRRIPQPKDSTRREAERHHAARQFTGIRRLRVTLAQSQLFAVKLGK